MNTPHAEPQAKEAAFTPGPWRVQPSPGPMYGTGIRRGTNWRDIVTDSLPFSPSYVGEALEQDAYVMAAAPELLAALKTLYAMGRHQRSISHESEVGHAYTAARAAIERATGGAQ